MINLVGTRFGKVVVLRREGTVACKSGTAPTWLIRCDCGIEKVVLGANLRRGMTRSCGCSKTKHGMYGTPEYKTWVGMIQRCENPNSPKFHLYGAAGITVCDRWKSFESFIADMGLRPSAKHSIDRIDGLKGYEPGNCRWATAIEQNTNRRTTRMIVAGVRKLSISEWARRTGLKKTTIRERLKRGWDSYRAVTEGAMPFDTVAHVSS